MKNVFLALLILGGFTAKAEQLKTIETAILISALDEAYLKNDPMSAAGATATFVSLMATGFTIKNIIYSTVRDGCAITIHLHAKDSDNLKSFILTNKERLDQGGGTKKYSEVSDGYKIALRWCEDLASENK